MSAIFDLIQVRNLLMQRVASGQVRDLDRLFSDIADKITEEMSQARPLTDERKRRIDRIIADLQSHVSIPAPDLTELGTTEAQAMTAGMVAAGLDVGLPPLPVLEAIAANTLVEGAVIGEWFQRLENQTRFDIARTIRAGVAAGRTNAQIARDIVGFKQDGARGREVMKAARRDATAVVRTAVQTIANDAAMAVFEANPDAVEGLEFVATLDSRTTIQCFPAETEISAIGSCEKIFRSKYVGEMIVVTTASGKQLRGTPNHPVLTAEGFLPLHKIKPSEHVIYSVTEDAIGIFGNQQVGMKTRIGDLFDSFVNHPGVDVSLKRASAQDFYGDGMFMADKIEIAATKGVLRDERDIAASQSVSDMLFCLNNDACRLPTNGGFKHHLLSWFPAVKAAMFKSGAINTRPNKGLRSAGEHFHNVSGSNPTSVHLNNSGAVSIDELVTFTALQSLHDSSLDQKVCDASHGTSVLFGQKPGALPVGVFADNVVSVRVEFASEHVFSIESSLGFYTANGLIVKNCSAMDGGRWRLDGTPMRGTKLPFRKPPLHWACRSRIIPITELSDDTGTRSSAVGPISAKITFEQFMERQGPEFAEQVLGKGRYEFYKANKLTLSQLIDPRSLEPLTLAELREKFN